MRNSVKGFAIALILCVVFSGLAFAGQTISLQNRPNTTMLEDQDNSGLTLKVQLGELRFDEVVTSQGDFTMMSAAGLTRSYEAGQPMLPLANRVISIPYGCDLRVEVIDYDVEEINLADYGITNLLMPAQPSLSKSDDPNSVPFEFDQATYNQAGFYSQQRVTGSVMGTMRALRLGLVSVAPFEYSPTDNVLRVYKELKIRVSFEGADWAKTDQMLAQHYSPVFEPVYRKVINYDDQVAYKRDDLVTYPVKYLIISDRMFEAQLQPFIEWKTKKGYDVEVAYTDVIGTSNTVIKSYIQGLYNAGTPSDPAPSFVLFVGDAQQITPFSGSAGSHITDLRFCEFTGDDFPEIYYGRFSAQNTTELQPQIDKTLEYEQYLMPDPSYLENVTLVAGVDGTYAPTHGNGAINYGTNLYFNTAHDINANVWLYPASDGSSASSDIIQSVSDGVGLYNYSAHCSHEGQADPSFVTSDIPGLTNYHQYLLGIGNCCLANTFGTDYSTDCFGEAFLKVAEKGGIGYIGGSNSTYWDEDYYWAVGYGPVVGSGPTYEQTGLGCYDGIFHDHGEPVSEHYVTNAAIMFAGNMAVTESGSSREQYYWEIYHLMGDPSVITYLGVPLENTVIHDAAILMTATTFAIEADPGSYVGLSINGELKGAGYVDETGYADITLTGITQPATADLVVTAQNRQPYITTVQIIAPSGPYVVFDSKVLNDAAGNGNSLVEPGEDILMGVQLINVGPDDAFDVNATISTMDSYVSLTDDNEAYGLVAGDNGTVYMADAFAFSLDGDTPDGHQIVFDLVVTGTARDTWEGTIRVPVHAPNLGFVSISIDDASGNGNGILDPGESAIVVATLENTGSGIAYETDAFIYASDPQISTVDNYGYFGTIDSINGVGNNATDAFEIAADAECPVGYAVNVQMDITAQNGFTATVNFNITVGDRVVFFYDDFAANSGWTGLGGDGEWTIGSPSGAGDDPAEDHTPTADNGVLGNDLTTSGEYNSGISPMDYVTSPIIDCGQMTGVQLKFYRWLGVERNAYDHAYFEVFDGSDWVLLYENGSTTFQDAEWNEEFYDLSAYADNNPLFQMRFGISSDGSVVGSGWNIDDIEIKGYGSISSSHCVITESSFSVSLGVEQQDTRTVHVSNTGEGSLRVSFAADCAWMSCATDPIILATDESTDVVVDINTAGLTGGVYNGNITFSTNDMQMPNGAIPVILEVTESCCAGVTGNINCDAQDAVDISDLTTLVNHLFVYFQVLCCPEEANVNGDPEGGIDISDLNRLVLYLFGTDNPPDLSPCQ